MFASQTILRTFYHSEESPCSSFYDIMDLLKIGICCVRMIMKALLIVDIQELYFSKYDVSLLAKINKRILEAQEQKQEIIYIKNTKRLKSRLITDDFACGLLVKTDNIFCKEQADLFSSKELLAFLELKNISDVEIIGIDGNSCISASAKGAIKHGYVVSINLNCIGVVNPLRFEKTKKTLLDMGVILK